MTLLLGTQLSRIGATGPLSSCLTRCHTYKNPSQWTVPHPAYQSAWSSEAATMVLRLTAELGSADVPPDEGISSFSSRRTTRGTFSCSVLLFIPSAHHSPRLQSSCLGCNKVLRLPAFPGRFDRCVEGCPPNPVLLLRI